MALEWLQVFDRIEIREILANLFRVRINDEFLRSWIAPQQRNQPLFVWNSERVADYADLISFLENQFRLGSYRSDILFEIVFFAT